MDYNSLDIKQKWYLEKATSLKGVLERAKEINCDLKASDHCIIDKNVNYENLISMKSSNLIKDYNIDVDFNKTNLFHIEIILNNDTKLISNLTLKFKTQKGQ